jgi:riboflavin synthase alpha subunit
MFTGIIERTVRIASIATTPMFRRLTIESPWNDVLPGESIAINGVCLTVAEITPFSGRPERGAAALLGFDVIKETLEKTNLGLLNKDDEIHLERSLRVGAMLSGHFVQGHVDGTATLLERIDNAHEFRLRVKAPNDLAIYITPKGSVAIDGVSLTVASMKGTEFEVALIPTTLQLTALGRREIGYPFNLETDMLNKTIVSYLQRMGIK